MSSGSSQTDIILAMSRITEFDAGFICGLVAGEGSFTGDRKQPVLAIKLHEDDPAPLLFVQEKLGGKIYGPYSHAGRRYYFWRLTGKSLQASLPLFSERLPASRKRNQFTEWIKKYGLAEILAIMIELDRVES
jgi:hypothetical protein